MHRKCIKDTKLLTKLTGNNIMIITQKTCEIEKEVANMLSVIILIGLAIIGSVVLWYGWKKKLFGKNYGIYWVGGGVTIFSFVIQIFQRERYQNLAIMVTGDVIILAIFVIAGIMGYKQNKAE